MSVIKEDAKGDLVPFSAKVRRWCYGDDDYVRSVFGTEKITREDLRIYYEQARIDWTKVDVKWSESWRYKITDWLKVTDIRSLDCFFPVGCEAIWFKHEYDAFAFNLKFGVIDKNYHFQYN
jgi:hypothetical protein